MKVVIWVVSLLVFSMIKVLVDRTIGGMGAITSAIFFALFMGTGTALSKAWDKHLLKKNGNVEQEAQKNEVEGKLGECSKGEGEKDRSKGQISYFLNKYQDYDKIRLKEIIENDEYSPDARAAAKELYDKHTM